MRKKVFHQPGTFLYKFGKEGNQDGELNWLYYLLVDSSDNLRDTDNDRVQQFSLDGRFTGESITRLPKPLELQQHQMDVFLRQVGRIIKYLF